MALPAKRDARAMSELARCPWVGHDPLLIHYHDEEWGVPLHDDRKLFEFLILEGAQAGLSWSTILKKRDAYREAFDQFDAQKIARYGEVEFERLMADAGIVRNRAKIRAAFANAGAFLGVQQQFGSFDRYIWQFGADSKAMSTDLRRRGFKFVGPTICYAFMQATGMVDDHADSCFRSIKLKA